MSQKVTGCVILILALAAGIAFAGQGNQSGNLGGLVRDTQGLAVPGATVRAVSPAQQGERVTTTDGRGAYLLPGLRPGHYTLTVELAGFTTVTSDVDVPLGGVASLEVSLRPAAAIEMVTVVATPSRLTGPTAAFNVRNTEVENLPIGRTPSLIAEFAPGLTNNTPNVNQVTISGAMAYDNVFLLDGVDIGDNLLARPDDLFIEEAIEETQVLTSGVSAEYGRFSGGVVNVVSKRGGNLFSGSIRSNLSNAAWTAETPFEEANGQSRASKMDRYYEGTLGGPLMKDRVWFFGAARSQRSQTPTTLAQSAAQVVQKDEQNRWELKVTASPMASQTVQVQYMDRTQASFRPSLPITIDPTATDTQDTPGNLLVANWSGVALGKTFATAQYSQKANHPRFGNTSTQLKDSPFLTIGRVTPGGLEFNAPYFDRNDPEDRDNRQLTGSVSYFASRPGLGTHDVKAGAEWFDLVLRGGNSQSSTGYIFNTDYLVAGGKPATDANGKIVPVWIPGATNISNSIPTRGAEIGITTTSFYLQDRWTPANRITLDLGLRFEHVSSVATGDSPDTNANTIVPRLGATFDMMGDGRTILGASYGHYSGRYTSSVFGRNTAVGNPARVTSTYNGPAGQGLDFAPAFDFSNYSVSSGSFPTANIFLEDGLHSPLTRELTLSAGRNLGAGFARAVYILRQTSGLVESFIDDPTAAGKTTVVVNGTNFGTFDNTYYRNTNDSTRAYQALQFEGGYRIRPEWTLNGHWTMQLENHGNFEGEAANQPGIGSPLGDYPELFVADRNFPTGRLDDFQRHKVRVWSIYRMEMGRFGGIDLTPVWRYNSALTYSLVANSVPLSTIQRARNPGYARVPTSQALFFDERGSEEFAGYALVDLGATYQVPIWKTLKPWVRVEVLNLLGNDKLIGWDTTITADAASPLDANGLPTGYVKGARFGQATSTAQYPRPRPGLTGGRTYLGAFGLRF